MCRISDSCRKTGHPPEYMSNNAVEAVYNDAVQVKAGEILNALPADVQAILMEL